MNTYRIFIDTVVPKTRIFLNDLPNRIRIAVNARLGLKARLHGCALKKRMSIQDKCGITLNLNGVGFPALTLFQKASLEAGLGMECRLPSLYKRGGAKERVGLSGSCNVSLRRYRRLEEFDELALNDMDGFTLEELDYIKID